MRVITYAEFFKNFVLRKKNELLNPQFKNLSELSLPRNSLIHFFPKNENEIGPSVVEPLISSYPDQVFIDFHNDFHPVLDTGKFIMLEIPKEIKRYRGKHYNYNWTKDINTVYRKEKVLIVKSYGLVEKRWISRPMLFSKFTSLYDKQVMLFEGINKEAVRGNRHQFIKIDLPNTLPSFVELLVDYDNYIGSFKEGNPTPNNKMFRNTKGEGSYWLLDLLALLTGDLEYSNYNRLTKEGGDALNIVFNYHGRCLVIKYPLLMSWLGELDNPVELEKIAKIKETFFKENEELINNGKRPKEFTHVSYRTKHPKRLNVTKRIYLSLLNLVRSGVAEEEIKEEEILNEEREERTELAKSTGSNTKRSKSKDKEKTDDGDEDEMAGADTRPSTLADILSVDEGDDIEFLGKGKEERNKTVDTKHIDKTTTVLEEEIEEEDWAGEVDDSLLEEEVSVNKSSLISLDKDPFSDPTKGVEIALEERVKEGGLSVSEYEFFKKKANRYKEITLDNGQTLEAFIDIKESDIDSLKEDAKIFGDLITVTDDSMLRSRSMALRKNYVKKFLQKDIVSMFLSVQNAGICVNDFKIEEVSGVEGKYDVYSFQLHPVDGDQTSHSIRFPQVNDEGMFVVDGVRSHLQLQRRERPIRKIDKDRVVLTSYYPNQLMLTRSRKVVDNLSSYVVKQLVASSKVNKEITFSRGNEFRGSSDAPRDYTMLASMFQWIRVGDLVLDFRFDELVVKHPEFKKLNKTDNFLIGVSEGLPVTIDSFGAISIDGVYKDALTDLLKIDMSRSPVENVVVNISGYMYPIGVILCYYFGIDKLIKETKLTTRTVPMGNRPNINPATEFAIVFNDEYLIFNKNQKLAGLIFGGMVKLTNISNYSRSDLNEKGIWVPLMGDPKVKPQHFLEMKNLYDLFIDPITKKELAKLKYSESFHYLLIDAVKLLEVDKTAHEVEILEQRIVGYERFAGHAYRELCISNRAYRNKGRGRKHKLDINPEAVITNIITDTSVNLVEQVNPVHEVKDQEELTFGGTGGQKDISVVKRARVQLESYRGIVSEANKDSGKVGFITYLTSDPMIEDYRGNISANEKPTYTGLSSVTGNLAFGITKDD